MGKKKVVQPGDPPELDKYRQGKRASAVEAKAVKWLWMDRIPRGMISLVAGRPGEGKSLFSAMLAAEISRRSNVIFSNMEDAPAHVVRPRLEAAGANLDRVHFWSPSLPRDLVALEAMIKALDVEMVIMDPVAAHLRVSIFNDQEVRTVLSPLTGIASENDCAIVLIHHTVKNVSGHPLSAIGGASGGLPGAARTAYIFGPNPDNDDERVLCPVKFNIGPSPKTVSFDMDETDVPIKTGETMAVGRLTMLADDLEINAMKVLKASGERTISAEKRATAAEWLTEYLSDGAKPVPTIKIAVNLEQIAWRTLRRAADEIGVVRTKVGGGPGSYTQWELPPGHPALGGN